VCRGDHRTRHGPSIRSLPPHPFRDLPAVIWRGDENLVPVRQNIGQVSQTH